jgi:hypothetical protein
MLSISNEPYLRIPGSRPVKTAMILSRTRSPEFPEKKQSSLVRARCITRMRGNAIVVEAAAFPCVCVFRSAQSIIIFAERRFVRLNKRLVQQLWDQKCDRQWLRHRLGDTHNRVRRCIFTNQWHISEVWKSERAARHCYETWLCPEKSSEGESKDSGAKSDRAVARGKCQWAKARTLSRARVQLRPRAATIFFWLDVHTILLIRVCFVSIIFNLSKKSLTTFICALSGL